MNCQPAASPTQDGKLVTVPTSVLALAICFPTLVTFVYFVVMADQLASIQQASYGVGKFLQFVFPVAWVALVMRQPIRFSRPTMAGVPAGLLFGAVVLGAMLALYWLILKPAGFFDQPALAAREKITDLGLNSLPMFVATALFYALCHSALEEYYWRWFLFRMLRSRAPLVSSIALSSLGFMLHHVILLGTYFGWQNPATWLFSLAVAIGGAVWALLYEKSGSLLGPWLSHLLVDTGIFIVGYDLASDLIRSG